MNLTAKQANRLKVTPGRARRGVCCRGIALIDCLIYLVLLMLLFGLTVLAFLDTMRHSTELDRVAVTTVRALQAGEQWREDVRLAREMPRLIEVDGTTELRLAGPSGEIAYTVRDGVALRRAAPNAPWLEVLNNVKVSQFTADPRKHVTAWRWEIELIRRRESQQLRRVLTFQAVPGTTTNP